MDNAGVGVSNFGYSSPGQGETVILRKQPPEARTFDVTLEGSGTGNSQPLVQRTK